LRVEKAGNTEKFLGVDEDKGSRREGRIPSLLKKVIIKPC